MKNFEILSAKKAFENGIVLSFTPIKTEFESIQTQRPDGYPKVSEIKSKVKFNSNPKDPNYDLPWDNLNKII
jgi:hypothetical protein